MSFFLAWYGGHRDLHVLPHSVPTRRSSDLEHYDSVSVRRLRNDRQPRQQDPQDLPHRNASPWKFTVPSPPRPLPGTAHGPCSSSPPTPSRGRKIGRAHV